MKIKSLGDAYNPNTDLRHTPSCECPICTAHRCGAATGEQVDERQLQQQMEQHAEQLASQLQPYREETTSKVEESASSEDMFDRMVENAVVRSVFDGNDFKRREFLKMVGGGTLAAILGSILPLNSAKAALKETIGKPEKSKLKVGFVPITCATPIIMAKPMGFYEKYGLDVDVIKTAGWAVARDKSLNKEYDASHMWCSPQKVDTLTMRP